MDTFDNSKSWSQYRRLLKEEFGIDLSMEPTERWIDVRGHHLRVDEWHPQTPSKGTLVLVHGGGGNGRILAPFAEPAAALGWKVVAPDLPGYGLTKTARSFKWDYAEWPAVVAEIVRSEDDPTALMGLSMGGMTAVLAAQIARTVRGVIATTLLDASDPKAFASAARWTWLGHISVLAMNTVPWIFDRLVLPLSLVAPFKAMSSNRRMQRYFAKDHLIGASWKPVRFLRTLHQYPVSSYTLNCPLVLIHPGRDEWTPLELSLETFDKIESRKRLVELSNGAHLPLEQPAYDELKNEMADCLTEILETPGGVPVTSAPNTGG